MSVRPSRQRAPTTAQQTPTMTIDASKVAASASIRGAAQKVPTPARLRAADPAANVTGVAKQQPDSPSGPAGAPASPLAPSDGQLEAPAAGFVISTTDATASIPSPPAAGGGWLPEPSAQPHPCQPGSYYDGGAKACSPCPAGHFTDIVGALRCVVRLALSAGHYMCLAACAVPGAGIMHLACLSHDLRCAAAPRECAAVPHGDIPRQRGSRRLHCEAPPFHAVLPASLG